MTTERKASRSEFAKRYGPWAVVTGASDGIGKACADLLAARGLNLILVARRKDVLEDLSATYRSMHEIECEVMALDLSNADAIPEIVAAARTRETGLLVAAAGYGLSGPFLLNDVADELKMIDVNCRAVAALSHHLGQSMSARGRGGIILFSSLLAFQGVPGAANYAATKAYVQSFAEGLRSELRPRNVDVLSVAPGPVKSGFASRANMTYALSQGPEVVARQALAALGRKGTVRPGYLAKALEFSLSPLPRSGRVQMMRRVMAGMANKPA